MIFADPLLNAYNAAPEIKADKDSRFVLFSDCHRSDGSLADDFAPNRSIFLHALGTYNREGYTYIELGDGDELWETERLSDILSENTNVFALMSHFYSAGRLRFLYGNHDMVRSISNPAKNPYLSNDEFTELFPGIEFPEGLKIDFNGKKLFLVHGHQADFFNSVLWRLSRFLVRHLWKGLENLGVNDPSSASKNQRKKSKVEKKLIQWAQKYGVMLIAGHTHRAFFPNPGNGLYFNDGCCVYRDHISALEIENGNISLVNWRLRAGEDGVLFIGKKLLKSAKIEDYFRSHK